MDDRLLRHNSGRSKYTKFGVPWQLVYLEEFKNKTEAYRRELEIKKKKSRNYIERLIAR
jgi:putative endonuclease